MAGQTHESARPAGRKPESPRGAPRKPAPTVNPAWTRLALDTDAERAAERAADEVERGLAATPPPAPPSELPDDVRARLWPTLGDAVDLARLHTDDEAARRAADLHARAFTAGTHISFARGAFRPDSAEGLRLLAHEVAHVAQNAATGTNAVHLKPDDPKPRAFYQDFEDRAKAINPNFPLAGGLTGTDIAALERKTRYEKLAELGHAIEDKRKDDAKKLLNEYLVLDKTNLFLGTMTDAEANEYAVQLFTLGLPAESAALRKHHGEQVKDNRIFDPDFNRRKLDFWKLLTDRTLAGLDTSTAATASAAIDALAPSFAGVRDEILEIDPNDVDSQRRGYTPGSMERIHSSLLLYEYWDGLILQLGRLFEGMQTAFQTMLDAAVAALQSGDDKPLQEARKALNDQLLPATRTAKADVLGAMTKITKSTFEKKKGRYLDVFLTGKAAAKRSEKFNLYDVTKDDAPEMQMTFDRMFQIRLDQVEFLAKLYGGRDAAGKVGDDAKQNAAVEKLIPGGKLNLHSDDDWREFARLKFRDLVDNQKQSAGDALTAVIKLLESYFRAFTVHTPYNLEDIDTENYLGRDFPRALTGQLIQDCGVYALRVAYILSKLRGEQDLDLTFRFVVMPVHLGLVVTGVGLPTYIAQNGSFNIIDPKELGEMRKDWDAWKTTKKVKDPDNPFAEKEVPADPEGKQDDDQFLGELTTQLFILGPLDMPFKIVDVPDVKGDAAAVKKSLWARYKAIAPTELFGPASKDPKSPEYQYVLRYLGILEEQKRIFNTLIVPFWNKLAPERHRKLSADFGIGGKEKQTLPGPATATALDAYVTDVRKLMQGIDDADARVAETEKSVGRTLRGDPKLQAKGIRLAYGLRTARFVFFQWRKDLDSHFASVTALAQALRTEPEVEASGLGADLKPPFPPGGEAFSPREW